MAQIIPRSRNLPECDVRRRPIRLLLGLSSLFLLASCSWYQAIQQHQEMTRSLNAYVGKSVADVARDRGLPTHMVDLGANRRGFEWESATETPEVATPAPGSGTAATLPPSKQSCFVSFVASSDGSSPSLSDWTIESSQLKGSC
jgi:hypothetical protein